MDRMKHLIFHIPHASLRIPDDSKFLISREEVDAEALYLTDLYTDELFSAEANDVAIRADFSRVFCDVERFENDALEPMSQFGMGATYLRCDDGRELRRLTSEQRNELMAAYYEPHHARFTASVDASLESVGEARIIDCHSFPNIPLRCSLYQGGLNFDFNIGTDPFHTPQEWVHASEAFFKKQGFRLGVDVPYTGSIVPMKHYQKNKQVKSIMLEINRDLYMDDNYNRGPRFDEIRDLVSAYLSILR